MIMNDEKQYVAGRQYAEFWIKHGGSLNNVESPDGWSDAKCNGFHDRIVEERRAIGA
jgi:hypothetical protein